MYIAHKNDDRVQTVMEHLTNAAKLSGNFGAAFHCEDLAYICGLLHDVGKYSDAFQARIMGSTAQRVDHATAGGQLASAIDPMVGMLVAYCIMGHHGGLPNGGDSTDTCDSTTLQGRIKRTVPDYSHYTDDFAAPVLTFPSGIVPIKKGGFTLSLLVRMLYSCLVDADFLDTERFMLNAAPPRGNYPSLQALYDAFFSQRNGFPKSDRPINQKRNEILQCCIKSAEDKPGIFTLTVPTGGGKTLSSMAFALKHAVAHGMQRIIYVIPYTSIIEQTARTFRDIFGENAVLEHHSNFDFGDEEQNPFNRQKLSAENWDIPIVVTTNVQFFESFFAYRSSRCRKLHHVAGSVIIFDEAQMLPTDYLMPCLYLLAELTQNYGCTSVLCSATQPAIAEYLPLLTPPAEICANRAELYRFFKRTKIVSVGSKSDEDLAAELDEQLQVLCIVNARRHALALFNLLKKPEESFHLSTLMCPAHRRKMLDEIKQRLASGAPCRVISTQLIEAGVDIDFPIVYRAMAGLDSIVQSAGRCNREGKQACGNVCVFEPESQYLAHMPNSLRQPIAITQSIFRNFAEVTSPEAISQYFKTLYQHKGEFLDSQKIIPLLEEGAQDLSFPFRDVAEKFALISENTRAVILPYNDKAKELIDQLQTAQFCRNLLRSAQNYTVNIYEKEFDALYGEGKIKALREDVFALRAENFDACYSIKTGLTVSCQGGIGIFI